MMRKSVKQLAFAVFCLANAACMEGAGPSLLTSPKILAMRVQTSSTSTSSTSSAYLIDAVGHDIGEITYKICVSPWIPDEQGVNCSSLEFPLPPGPVPDSTFIDLDAYSIPDDYRARLETLYIRADDTSGNVVPAIFELELNGQIDNPELESISINNEPAENWSPSVGEHTVSLNFRDGYDPTGTITSFFTTEGSFSPWRSFDGLSSKLTIETQPAELKIFVITRRPGEGVSWVTKEAQQ